MPPASPIQGKIGEVLAWAPRIECGFGDIACGIDLDANADADGPLNGGAGFLGDVGQDLLEDFTARGGGSRGFRRVRGWKRACAQRSRGRSGDGRRRSRARRAERIFGGIFPRCGSCRCGAGRGSFRGRRGLPKSGLRLRFWRSRRLGWSGRSRRGRFGTTAEEFWQRNNGDDHKHGRKHGNHVVRQNQGLFRPGRYSLRPERLCDRHGRIEL